MKHSYTRLKDYASCPLYYKLRHVDKVPFTMNEALNIGIVGHDILKNYALTCYKQKRTNLFERWEAIARSTMEEYKIPPDLEETILDMVKGYVSANEIELEGLAGVEEQIAVDEKFNLVKWDAENVWFRAVCDLLYIFAEHGKIKDYKTGYSMRGDRFQFEVYVWLLFNIYPDLQQIEVEFDYIRFSFKTNERYTRDQLPELDRKVRSRIKQIESDKEFTPCVSSFCGRCTYWNLCPAIKMTNLQGILPKNIEDAQKLLKLIYAEEKLISEQKDILKGYVEEFGTVEMSDLQASNSVVTSRKYDVPGLLLWAKDNDKNIVDALTIDTRKIKKLEIPPELVKISLSTRFKIGKKKEGKTVDD